MSQHLLCLVSLKMLTNIHNRLLQLLFSGLLQFHFAYKLTFQIMRISPASILWVKRRTKFRKRSKLILGYMRVHLTSHARATCVASIDIKCSFLWGTTIYQNYEIRNTGTTMKYRNGPGKRLVILVFFMVILVNCRTPQIVTSGK